MKSLRGAKSEDIIFAGTEARKSLGFAEVSIVFDNTDGKLPIEYGEVTVTRKIYRSGETGYFINKTPCRLKDILELFMDTGIGKDGYSIIGQGKIDEILSNKSEDRRHIFEEAAGIVKYRTRKAESEKKLEQTKLNLLRINDILSEIEATIEPLKIQSDKAKEFLDLREELKSIEVGLFLHNIETYKEKIEQITKDEIIMQEQKQVEDEKMTKLQTLKETLKQEIDSITLEIERLQNIGFESTNKIEKIHAEIGISNGKIENNTENIKRIETEIQELIQKGAELEEESKQKKIKKETLFQNKEKFQKELEEKEKQLEEISQKLSDKELEIENKKQTIEKDIDLRYECSEIISNQEVNYENLQKRQKNVSQEITAIISELDGARSNKQELNKGFLEIRTQKENLDTTLKQKAEEKQVCMNKIKEFDDTINRLSYELRMKDARLKFLIETEKEKEGYIKSVKSLLKDCEKDEALNKGTHGVLANLISVQKEYETAIEMCLGQTLQNVVTQTEEDAKKLVEHLRKNNLGRASFLPISSVRGKKIDRMIKNSIEGVIGIAADLVKCDKQYEQIVLNLLGRTVVVKNMDTAISLAKQNSYSFRIVTLEGDIISPTGAISGGSLQTKTVNILGRSREIEDLEKQIKELNEKIQNATKSKEEYSTSITDVIEEVSKLEKSLQDAQVIYAAENQKMIAIEENIQKLEIRKDKLQEENTHLEEQKKQILELKEEKKKEIEALTSQIDSLNKIVEEFASKNKENQKYIDDLNFDITNLKISVSSFDESGFSLDEMLERIKQDIQNNKLSIENKKSNITAMQSENENLKQTIAMLNEQIKQTKENVQNSSTKVEELKNTRTDKNASLSETEKQINEQFSTIDGLKEQLVKIDVKKTKTQQDLEQVVNNLWEEYELTPNAVEQYQKPENIALTQKQVSRLRSQIKDLGSINIDAIEEYKKTKERYDFMCEQRQDLETAASKLRKVISDMTETMKIQFAEKFKQINKNFNEVFTELFGGGKAELILQDEENILECGIDIQVQPTGKKLQNMMLLSGGEKAFTAIALLFAILKINPAPFCILDEIEAALDDVNVYRFAEYLKKFSSQTQFLVITHRKGTMEAADTVYGVTMEENGISKLLSMRLA